MPGHRLPPAIANALGLSLAPEQRFLARHSPTVAAERAVAADHTMAGHDQREAVRGAGARDRAHRAGTADGLGDVRIAARLAARDAHQLLPHAPLERARAHVHRDRAALRRIALRLQSQL